MGVQKALQDIMSDNLENHILTFTTYGLDQISKVDRDPDLIFLDLPGALAGAGIAEIRAVFPRKTCVVLAEATEPERRACLHLGIDEVISLSELRSGVGRRLLEKLIALKDLTEAELKVEQSEERFRGIIEHVHDIIMLVDGEGTIVYASPAFTRHLTYEAWEVLGRPFLDLVYEEDQDKVARGLERIIQAPVGEGGALRYRLCRKDGEPRHFEAMATNLLGAETVGAVVLNFRDVTQQKVVEEELGRYRRHLEKLVDRRTQEVEEAHRMADAVIAASATALIALDGEGYIRFISRNYVQVYPRSAYALAPGAHIAEAWDAVCEESGIAKTEEVYGRMRAWLLNPQDSIEYRRRDGAWVRLHARRTPGQPGVVIATMDISDYKRQQALLAAQSAELSTALAKEKEVVEQQRSFISLVSHEFRTPLAIIDGNAQIIGGRGDTLPKEVLSRRADTIRAGVQRLVRLIETFLSSGMIENGKLELKPAPCDLTKILREVCADQQDISPRHRIKLTLADLPPDMNLDEKLIRQAFVNLLSNAVKYSPEGKLVEVEAAQEDGGQVLVKVRDHGVGIPAEEAPRIFQKYFRASTSGDIPGSGLGLSFVRQFIELHGGRIAFESQERQGTTFSVMLPGVQSKVEMTEKSALTGL